MLQILVQTLLGVSASRPDLVPFYARMIATLCPVMPDVEELVTTQLQSEFRMYRRRIAHVSVIAVHDIHSVLTVES